MAADVVLGVSIGPGESIRQSGIYEVLHELQHRETHEAVMISGEKFPDCETCKDKVRFRLVRTAPYIFQDQDFERRATPELSANTAVVLPC